MGIDSSNLEEILVQDIKNQMKSNNSSNNEVDVNDQDLQKVIM